MQKRAKKCTNNCDARANLFLHIKPIVFLTFSLPSASLDLKVPNMNDIRRPSHYDGIIKRSVMFRQFGTLKSFWMDDLMVC